MKTVAVSEVKAKLSEYLSQVKAGGEVLITERGEPVARLSPVSHARSLKESLTKMERAGLIKIGSGKLPKGFWSKQRVRDPAGHVLRALLEERETGR